MDPAEWPGAISVSRGGRLERLVAANCIGFPAALPRGYVVKLTGDIHCYTWCTVIENPDTVLHELRARQGRTTALDEKIERVQATIKTLDAQKHRAMRLFTIGEADDADVKRELSRINKLHLQARARLAELEGRRAVSAQIEPLIEKVAQYCALMRDRLNDLSFEQKREVLEALQAQFTLEKNGQLRMLLVLPTDGDISSYTTLRHASGYMAQRRMHEGVTLSRVIPLK